MAARTRSGRAASDARPARAARPTWTHTGIPARGCARSRRRDGCGSRARSASTARAPTGWCRGVKSIVHGRTERIGYLVDAETYLPLASRFTDVGGPGDRIELSTRYLVYERLPLNDR